MGNSGTKVTPVVSTQLDYLIPEVRLVIGDTEPTTYRYLDTWIRTALIASIKVLQLYWRFKYLINDAGIVIRNTGFVYWDVPESEGIIQKSDEFVIVLMASQIILQGSLENSAWDLASWKDNEISYNPLEGGRIRSDILKRITAMLNDLILPPTKRLARAKKGSLPGYKNNPYERDSIY